MKLRVLVCFFVSFVASSQAMMRRKVDTIAEGQTETGMRQQMRIRKSCTSCNAILGKIIAFFSCCFRKQQAEIEMIELPDIRSTNVSSMSLHIEPSHDHSQVMHTPQEVYRNSSASIRSSDPVVLPGAIAQEVSTNTDDTHTSDFEYEFIDKNL